MMNPQVRCAVQLILGAVLVGSGLPAQAASEVSAAAAPAPALAPMGTQDGSASSKANAKHADNLRLVTINGYHHSAVLSALDLQRSTQPVKAVPHSVMELIGPAAGGMQALATLPNVYVNGYNSGSASARSTISMRGVKVGWNSIPGDLETNAITAELDGVPLNSLSQGTGWHSTEVPIGALMSGINAIEGPGNPRGRWYNSLGGTINFIPVQPTAKSGGKVTLAGGSFDTAVASAVFNTGAIDGWSTVVGAAAARQETFRQIYHTLPSDSEQGYIKTRKQLDNGSISVGGYYSRSDEWRPNMIPVAPNSQIYTGGVGGPGTLYSQQTSGFYATLPRSIWHKHNEIVQYLLWSHLHLNLSKNMKLSNLLWVRVGKVRHYRTNNYLLPGNPYFVKEGSPTTNVEHFVERSRTLGDRVVVDKRFGGLNTVSVGGYFIASQAKSQYQGYSSFDGSSLSHPEAIYFNTTNSMYWAVFLQDDFSPLPRLHIVPGFRVVDFITDFSNNSPAQVCIQYNITDGSCAYGTPGPSFGQGGQTIQVNGKTFTFQGYDTNPDESTNFVRTEPSIGVNYALGDGVNLFASYAIARHNPSSGNLDTYPLVLATLKPSRAQTYDGGVRYVGLDVAGMRKLYASLEYFHTLLDNQTIGYSYPQNPGVTYFGYGSATLKGVDLSLRATFNRHWSGFANFGWLKSVWNQYFSSVTPSGKPINLGGVPVSNSPKDTLTAGVSYRFFLPAASFKATLWDQYVGTRYLWDNNAGQPTSQTMPAYDLVNFSLTANTKWLSSHIDGVRGSSVSLQVLNLTNKEYNSTEYISSGGYFQTTNSGYIIANPGTPRAVYLSVSLKF